MTNTIIINGNNIHDIQSFYQEINRVFMYGEDWQLGNSLDAFNDLLYGGYGTMKDHETTTIIWLAFEKNRLDLGYECTKDYYKQKLAQPELFNQKYFLDQLEALEDGKGQTYFDILAEIISEHGNIELVCR
ncbi:barstar family protein [Polluticaenibacter yanchengensis]|uniref:Barstar family protein n=1 Tax=Polluticaenibacter yanchengensis TaxID=3014562 RepID=A0ABT4UF84_9BACT|nr:barstar family protein [Chitinophagaceae bacterium LY-5]